MPVFQFPPFVLILIVSFSVSSGLSVYALKNRNSKLHLYFGISMALACVWPFLYGIELILTDRTILERISIYKPVAMQFFPISFTYFFFQLLKQKAPPRWYVALMFGLALMSAFSMVTNDIFQLAWGKKLFITTIEGYHLIILYQTVWMQFLVLVYHFGCYTVILIMLIPAIGKYKHPYKGQLQIVTAAIIFGLFISFVFTYGLIDFGPYNPIPASLAFTSLILAFSVFKYKLLNIAPYARESVFEVISTPVIITDQDERLLDFNQPAAVAFRLETSMISKQVADVFTDIGLNWESLDSSENVIIETRWGAGSNYKYSALKKPISKGGLQGYLIIFTDVTTQMDALKTEHEKEIITYKESILGDMHDGIGGTVATAAIIAQAAQEEECLEEKNRMIGQIASLLENGSFELRSMLNILDKESINWSSLVSDMRSYSSTVLDAKGISREFKAEGTPYTDKIDFDIYLSIFRLFKETITNIIKHSKAEHAKVLLTFEQGCFKICVSDDGKGMDEVNTTGYGIKNMKRRAEKLGGTLTIESVNGTQINIGIPV